MRTVRIYLFGDSICFGQLVSSQQTWATALATALEGLNSDGRRFLVQNAGVNGNTTRQALERLHYDVSSHRPDYVLVQFGMNDCNHWESDCGEPRVSRQAFAANLREIVAKCVAAGTRHCFINTNHPSNRGAFVHTSRLTYDESNSEYSAIIRTVTAAMQAEGMPVSGFDVEMVWRQYLQAHAEVRPTDLLLEDGIHLSVSGHRLYAETLIAGMLEKITDLEKR